MSDIKRVNVNSTKATINPDYDAKLNHTDASLFTADALKYIAGYNPANGINMQNAVDVLAKKHTNLESKAAYVLNSDSESDLDLSDEKGNVIARFSEGHFQTKNFDSSVMTDKVNLLELIEDTHPYVINNDTEENSLDISDENDNVIARFTNGHIQTKFFDSSIITTKLDNINDEFTVFAKSDLSNADLNIGDENGYVIAQFRDGHIKTKNFNSSKIEVLKYRPYSASNIRFQVQVNCKIPDTTSNTIELLDSIELYYDKCVLMLPESYTPDGTPTRLVIGCHGAGGGTTDTDSQIENSDAYKYLVANGYAIMDVNGIPQEYCTKYGVNYLNNVGSPIAVESYIKAYQWVITYYNIAQDGVMVSGGSMGGISSSNLVLSNAIKVLAHGVSCPVLDTYNHIFLHPWSGGLPKTALGVIYGFDKDENNNYIYSEEKLNGYNPIVNGMLTYNMSGLRVTSVGLYNFSNHKLNGEDVIEYKSYPCPLKIWHCDNDNTVNQSVSIRQITAIRNAGGRAWLRRFPSGGHEPTRVGSPIANPTGNINYKGQTIPVLPYAEELLLFFNRYNNKFN